MAHDPSTTVETSHSKKKSVCGNFRPAGPADFCESVEDPPQAEAGMVLHIPAPKTTPESLFVTQGRREDQKREKKKTIHPSTPLVCSEVEGQQVFSECVQLAELYTF